ncbi:DNA ligase (ATP) [Tephrocybe rancida]|nr:DNA ligase (ATP) [Tephrocybe rancida]
MNISVKETTVFAVFHPDAQDLYNTCSDLKRVAYELWDQSYRLNAEDKTVQLFHAFAPMLCKRPTKKIEDSVREMGGSDFFIEEKLDGERMQLHKRGNEYFYCSRKGKDYTYLYGKHIGTGSLTPFIDKAFDSRIDEFVASQRCRTLFYIDVYYSIILDGEMLVWDPVSERNLPFGTLKTAALVKVFDLLYLNGQSLLHRSTSFRKKNMRNCLKEITGRIEFAVEYKGKTAKDVRDRMDEVMSSRGEGLVIKHPLSKYVLNGRNMDWIKVKPEYMDNMGETVDVLVVAGNYGSGKRGGGVSTLICAVMDDRRSTDDDDDEPKYSSFVRIGSGLSFADYVWVREKPWKTWDTKHPPAFLLTAKRSHEDKGDVYLEPEDSFILKVKAAEIVPSGYQYDMGFTMRFPRALSIRDDLSIADCMTATAILDGMRSEKKRKMESDAGVTQKKRKTVAKKAVMLPEYQGPKLKSLKVTSQLFNGLKFDEVVMSDPKSRTGDQDKKELMKLIHTNGGTCAQIAMNQAESFVVYGGKVTPYDLKLLIDKDIHDVIKPEWVTDSVDGKALAPFSRKYFFHAKAARVEADEFDDDGMEVDDEGGAVKPEEDLASPAPEPKEESPAPSVKEEQLEDDPTLADWFKVDNIKQEDDDIKYESVTDADSDNADVADEDDDLDDWFTIKKPSAEPPASAEPESSAASSFVDVTMGESENAMEYDEELIFRHLCFYLDSPENAHKNGLTVKSKHEGDLNKSFTYISTKIVENGGKVVDLSEPKLTHIIVDKRDDSRRLELMKRTSKPKRRHLVVSEFIQACLEEETLLDEEDFIP